MNKTITSAQIVVQERGAVSGAAVSSARMPWHGVLTSAKCENPTITVISFSLTLYCWAGAFFTLWRVFVCYVQSQYMGKFPLPCMASLTAHTTVPSWLQRGHYFALVNQKGPNRTRALRVAHCYKPAMSAASGVGWSVATIVFRTDLISPAECAIVARGRASITGYAFISHFTSVLVSN